MRVAARERREDLMALKAVRNKAELYWSRVKKLIVLAGIWGVIFSTATIGRLAVGFDYDDTLVFSTPAFQKAFADKGVVPYSREFWSVVNRSYDLERPKVVPYTLAWLFRLCGFRVMIISARPAVDVDGLEKDWRHLVPPSRQFFAGDPAQKHRYFLGGNFVAYFGDSDTDIEQARLAHVWAVRVRRSPLSSYKAQYHPGSLGEPILPLSQY